MEIGLLDSSYGGNYGYLMEKTSTVQKLTYQVRKEHIIDSHDRSAEEAENTCTLPFPNKTVCGQSWASLMILCPFNHRRIREGKILVILFWLFDFFVPTVPVTYR